MSEDPNFFVCGHANFQLNVEDPKRWTRKKQYAADDDGHRGFWQVSSTYMPTQ